VDPTLRPVWWRKSTTGQGDRGGESLEKEKADKGHKSALATLVREAAGLPDLLAMRRAAFEGRFA
jgi:hypothetical protein